MSTFDLLTGTQVYAERGTEEGRLDIMRDDGVATKDNLHIATPQQLSHVAARSSMDHRRPQYEQDFTAMSARLLHLACDLMNRQHFGFFGRDIALHKGKGFSITATLKGLHANPTMPNNHLLADLYL